MLLLGVSVSAEREMPPSNPPEGFEMPQDTPPDGMELPKDMQGFPSSGQEQKKEENTDNTQTEQPTNKTGENGENQQGQKAEAGQPNMDFGGGNMPGGFKFGGTQTEAEPMTFMGFVKEYQTPIISVALLLLAFVFVKLYKRKNY